MTSEEFLGEAARRLAGAGHAVEHTVLRGVPAVIGRRKNFRVQWMLSQLKTTVVVCAVETVTYDGWTAFLNDVTGIAKAFQGGLPNGLQSAFGAVPVLAGLTVDPAAASAAATAPARLEWFQGMTVPGLVDLTYHQVYAHTGFQFTGAVFIPFLRKQRNLVTSIVRPA